MTTAAEARETVEELRDQLDFLEGEAKPQVITGEKVTDDVRDGLVEVSGQITAELNRLEPLDPDAITEFGPLRDRARDLLALAQGGPAVCRLTQRPIAHLTDYGNAERIARAHADRLRYVPGLGFLVWDDRRWRRDTDGGAMRLAKQTARSIRDEARELDDAELAKKVFAHATTSERLPRLEASLKLARSEEALLVELGALDADPFAFNVANGTLDLRTGELRPHDPSDLLTMLAPVDHDPAAQAPTWAGFLERVLPEPDLRAWVQKLVGYALTADTSEQAMFVIHGDGANGKSVFAETIASMLGEYAKVAEADTFLATKGGRIPNDLARLPGARLVRAAETEEGMSLARQLVKRVTGQDTISARFLYGEHFEFRPTFKLAILTNNLPRIPAEDRATWRRVRLVPFAVRIPAAEQDRRLLAKLSGELPGVLNWALEGCRRWQREGLGVAETVRDATRTYRLGEDSVGKFVKERCRLESTFATLPNVVERAYLGFCEDRDLSALSTRELLASLESLGVTRWKSNGTRWWRGISVEAGTQGQVGTRV